jgi:tRNA(Ile)-lysidine synthase
MAATRNCRSTELLPAAVADCFDRHIGNRDSLVVGLSGGVDSVVLLHVIRSLQVQASAIHVHHGISSDADHWATFCHDLCSDWDIPLLIERIEVERGSADGLEAAARRARHDVYARQATNWIVLAHHQSDRAETLLFNLLRGAGVRGAGAMRERNGRLLRPLLPIGRSDILAYATLHDLTWVEDGSNADIRHSRNFLRHRILPTVKERFPAVESRLAKTAARFAEAADLLDELALVDLAANGAEFPLPVSCLTELSEPRARNVLRFLLAKQGVGIPSEERLIDALHQCLTAKPDRHPSVAFGEWRLRRSGRLLVLDRPQT